MTGAGRKPLGVMIALEANKLRGGHHDDAPPEDGDYGDDDGEEARPEHDDDGMKQACQDAIDAMSKRDPDMLNRAWTAWMDMYMSHQGGGEEE